MLAGPQPSASPVSCGLHHYPARRRSHALKPPQATTCGGFSASESGLAGHLGGVLVGAAADLVAEPDQRVVLAADHALLQRDDRVVGDLDVLRAHLGAALGDVAQPETE